MRAQNLPEDRPRGYRGAQAIRLFRARFNEDPGRMRRVATVTNVFATSHRDNGSAGEADHEQVVFCQDSPTGLRAIIGIYSTTLGPALGGTRFYPYASEGDALTDVLRLSRAM